MLVIAMSERRQLLHAAFEHVLLPVHAGIHGSDVRNRYILKCFLGGCHSERNYVIVKWCYLRTIAKL